jgi:hypothetical protein
MGWVVNATPRPLYPLGKPGTHCIGVWVGLRVILDWYGKSCPHRDSIPRTVQPVASRYTDWAIPVPSFKRYDVVRDIAVSDWQNFETTTVFLWALRSAWPSVEWVSRPVSPDVKGLKRGVGQSQLDVEESSIFTSISRTRYYCVVSMRVLIAQCNAA